MAPKRNAMDNSQVICRLQWRQQQWQRICKDMQAAAVAEDERLQVSVDALGAGFLPLAASGAGCF